MILSGMSDMEQMQDNLKTFSQKVILTEQEKNVLLNIAEEMKGGVPCTACRYCCDGCPQGLNIPFLLKLYNELITAPSMNAGMKIEALPREKQPSSCINCSVCVHVCPQNINIPEKLAKLDEIYSKMPRWEDICREREEAARKNREK
jgi:predicted aldo/keto reductase-like oxidoreductase